MIGFLTRSKRSAADAAIHSGDTYCFGRYLLTLPKGSTVKTQYIHGGAEVETHTGISPEGYLAMVDDKQHELENTPHYDGGHMFVERDDISDNQVVLVSWSSRAGRLIYRYIDFQYISEHGAVYVFVSKGNATEEDRATAAEIQREYGGLLRYRKKFEIPLAEGFCIDEGLVMTSQLNREEVLAVISLPEKLDVTLVFESHVTRNPGIGSNRRPFLLRVLYFTAVKTLRNRRRKIGPLKGRERLTRSRGWRQHKRAYTFEWKTPGKADDLAFPYMRVMLRHDVSDESGESSFSSDREALRLWDQLLNSLHIRPGAVGPKAVHTADKP